MTFQHTENLSKAFEPTFNKSHDQMVDFVIRHPRTSFLTTTAGRIGHVKQQHHAFKFVDECKGARDADTSWALGKFLISWLART
jgi:hypothetical protein